MWSAVSCPKYASLGTMDWRRKPKDVTQLPMRWKRPRAMSIRYPIECTKNGSETSTWGLVSFQKFKQNDGWTGDRAKIPNRTPYAAEAAMHGFHSMSSECTKSQNYPLYGAWTSSKIRRQRVSWIGGLYKMLHARHHAVERQRARSSRYRVGCTKKSHQRLYGAWSFVREIINQNHLWIGDGHKAL
jgi:hypothetical protein